MKKILLIAFCLITAYTSFAQPGISTQYTADLITARKYLQVRNHYIDSICLHITFSNDSDRSIPTSQAVYELVTNLIAGDTLNTVVDSAYIDSVANLLVRKSDSILKYVTPSQLLAYNYLTAAIANTLYQPLENQRISTTNNVGFQSVNFAPLSSLTVPLTGFTISDSTHTGYTVMFHDGIRKTFSWRNVLGNARFSFQNKTGGYTLADSSDVAALAALIAANTTAITGKEPTISASNISKYYWNGYKAFVPLLTDSIPEGTTNQYFTLSRARGALSIVTTRLAGTPTYNSVTGVWDIPQNDTTATNATQSYVNRQGFIKGAASIAVGSVIFGAAGNTTSQNNAQFFWDNVNNRLGIGTATPVAQLHIAYVSGASNSIPAFSITTTGSGSLNTMFSVQGLTTGMSMTANGSMTMPSIVGYNNAPGGTADMELTSSNARINLLIHPCANAINPAEDVFRVGCFRQTIGINQNGTFFFGNPLVTADATAAIAINSITGGFLNAHLTTAQRDSLNGIYQFTVTAGGSGYTSVPTVIITGGTGSGAGGTARIAAGVTSTTSLVGGSGYTSGVTISFTGGGGSGAAATATVVSGVVTAITITLQGVNYTSAPTMVFTPVGAGSGASATAVFSNYVSAINLNIISGKQYIGTPPTVSFSGGGGSGATATVNLLPITPGLQIYNTTTGRIEIWNGTTWQGSIAGNYSIFTPTTGATVTLVDNQNNIINPASSIANLTLALPSSPTDKDIVEITLEQSITGTLSFSGGTVISTLPTTTTGRTALSLEFSTATSTWY